VTLARKSELLGGPGGYEGTFVIDRASGASDGAALSGGLDWKVTVFAQPDAPAANVEWLKEVTQLPLVVAEATFAVTDMNTTTSTSRLVGIVRKVADVEQLVGYGPWSARWRFVALGEPWRAWVREDVFIDLCADDRPEYRAFGIAPDGAIRT
jgi:hypothetical protein